MEKRKLVTYRIVRFIGGEHEDLVRRGTSVYWRTLGALFSIDVGAHALMYAPQPLLRVNRR